MGLEVKRVVDEKTGELLDYEGNFLYIDRENLEATSRKAQMEAKADETEKMTSIMKTVPLLIYIGVLVFGFIFIFHDKSMSYLQHFI